jgi:acetyltransferase-like isoleucine patch superfamily enzyme
MRRDVFWLRDALLQRWWRWAVPLRLRGLGVTCPSEIFVYGWPVVSLAPGSSVQLGARVVLGSSSRFSALGVGRPVVLRTLKPNASIEIGCDTGLSGAVICAAQRVSIGHSCLIGADVRIFDTDFHPLAPEGRRTNNNWADIGVAPVEIGNNVFLGTASIICKGVKIGDDAVIGAGSVVVSDIPAGGVAAGNPARVLRSLYKA